MPRVGVQDPARGKECWAQHRAVPSASHHSGSVEWLGVQAGVAAAGNATSCPYWPGVGSSHGRRAPWQGVLSVPWGQAWVGAGAPRGGMWAGRGRGFSWGTQVAASSAPAAATQHGRETPNPALHQGEGGPEVSAPGQWVALATNLGSAAVGWLGRPCPMQCPDVGHWAGRGGR